MILEDLPKKKRGSPKYPQNNKLSTKFGYNNVLPVNKNFKIAGGNTFKFGKNKKSKLGVLGSLSYGTDFGRMQIQFVRNQLVTILQFESDCQRLVM